ncbi:hypothetical protein [Mesorhizobium sp. STM 4661]|uniref:hypothetical protein n=1 Tax=Mesorhizobium sp. STM 4661 TaxID=1297570 RepID=UPI0018DECF43
MRLLACYTRSHRQCLDRQNVCAGNLAGFRKTFVRGERQFGLSINFSFRLKPLALVNAMGTTSLKA